MDSTGDVTDLKSDVHNAIGTCCCCLLFRFGLSATTEKALWRARKGRDPPSFPRRSNPGAMGKLVPALVALVIAALAAAMACVHLGLIASPAFDNLPPLGDVAAARVRGVAHLAAEIVVLGPAGPLYARIATAARAARNPARARS